MSDMLKIEDTSGVATRLRAARKAAVKTQKEAADRIGVSRTTMAAIEKGERAVHPEELVALAELFGKPVNELLRTSPVGEDFVAEFRSSADCSLIDTEVLTAVSMLQELADDYVELERISGSALPQQYPTERPTHALKPTAAGEALEAAERNRLGLGDGPVLGLRQLLESDVGLRVFGLDLPGLVAGLFIGSTIYGACVAFNIKHPFERQRWTMAHEFGHFLTQRASTEVTALGNYGRVPVRERYADAFAENFLMPAAGVMRRFHEIAQSRPNGATQADLIHLADRFKVGVQTMALRLENLSLARAYTWDRLKGEGFKVGEARSPLAIEAHPRDREMLPFRYRCMAAEAYLQGELSEGQLARFLRVDRVRARQLVARLDGNSDPELDLRLNSPGRSLARQIGFRSSGASLSGHAGPYRPW